MKTKGIGMKTKDQPFIFLQVSSSLFAKGRDSFQIKEQDGFWQINNSSLKVLVRKRESYPQTFIFENEKFLSLGYVNPQYFSQFQQVLLRGDKEIDFFVSELIKKSKEFFLVVVQKNPFSLRAYRDCFCTLPIFYMREKENLFLSNQFIDLANLLPSFKGPLKIDRQRLAEYLFFRNGYPLQTVFSQIRILTERTVLFFQKRRIKIKLPLAFSIPSEDTQIRNFSRLFEKNININLKKYWAKISSPEKVAFEVSGGLDSLAVFENCCRLTQNKLSAFSLILDQSSEKGQKEKIEKIKKISQADFYYVSTADLWPLQIQIKNSLTPFYLEREIYFESLDKLAQELSKQGKEFVFTGIGGDEAFKIDPQEEDGFQGRAEKEVRRAFSPPDFFEKKVQRFFKEKKKNITPVPIVSHSVLSSHLARNNVYLKYNIWPLAPLADPFFLNFCRSLPLRFRKKKKILRDYLKKQGYPLSVSNPQYNENFGSLFERTIIRPEVQDLFSRLMSDSCLVQLGLIKKKELFKDYFQYQKNKRRGIKAKINPFYFYLIISIEILLQGLRQKKEE